MFILMSTAHLDSANWNIPWQSAFPSRSVPTSPAYGGKCSISSMPPLSDFQTQPTQCISLCLEVFQLSHPPRPPFPLPHPRKAYPFLRFLQCLLLLSHQVAMIPVTSEPVGCSRKAACLSTSAPWDADCIIFVCESVCPVINKVQEIKSRNSGPVNASFFPEDRSLTGTLELLIQFFHIKMLDKL